MKKIVMILCVVVFTLTLHAQTIVGTTTEDILQIGVIDGKTPVYVSKKIREGLISTIVEYYVTIGKEKAGPYDKVRYLQFSPDGKTLAYEVIIDGKWYIITGNEKAGPYDDVWWLQFSPDGKTLAYLAEINGEYYIIAGHEKAGPYDDVRNLQLSPDGKTLAYTAFIEYDVYSKILTNGKEYIGAIVNGIVIYIANGTIYIK